MLRATFRQFRCWENYQIEVPVGTITLIKGNSGVGKTTLLQGITWCLYGNIRLVAPNHMEGQRGNKAKTQVIFEIPYNFNGKYDILTIDRQKNPNRLIVTHGNNTYEDKVAQSIIDNLFGTHDIWLASCYIGQGCRNSFLTAPNTGKMELLNCIAFNEEDPAFYIERINTTINEADIEYKGKMALFTNNLNSLQSLLADVDVTKALTPDKVVSINSMMKNLIERKKVLQEQKTDREINLRILNNLQEQLEKIKEITIPKPNDELLNISTKYGFSEITHQTMEVSISESKMDSIISQLIEIISMLQKRDHFDSEIKKLDSLLLPYVNIEKIETTFTQSDYQDALSKELAFNDNQKTARILNVLYSETSISDAIKYHQHILEAQERLKLEQNRDLLYNRINQLKTEHLKQTTPLIFPDLTPNQIQVPDYSKYSTTKLTEQLAELSQKHGSLQTHIGHLRKGLDVLQCPQCKNSLRYHNGNLLLAETEPSNLDELSRAQDDILIINNEKIKIKKSIESMMTAEANEKFEYEKALIGEQKRLDALKEKVKQLELEQQKRDLTNQAREKQISELNIELQEIIEKIETMPIITTNAKILTNIEINQAHMLIGKLSNIKILKPPTISSQQIQSYLNYQDLRQKNTIALATYIEYIKTIPEIFKTEQARTIQNYIEQLKAYWRSIREASEERIRQDRLKISLEDQIKTTKEKILKDPSDDIDNINKEIEGIQQALLLSVKAHEAIHSHTCITKEREEILKLNKTLADLQTLRQRAIETECNILQQVVESINASIQNVCTTLFNSDINITLDLFKTMKTTKNVKPMVNFTISYQGGNFDNINQMSGGEGDRASLALTIALNRLSSCPLLMLDESLASLDLDMKEAAIRTLKENTNNTVLVIMHDGIEGIFSNTIYLDNVTQGRY